MVAIDEMVVVVKGDDIFLTSVPEMARSVDLEQLYERLRDAGCPTAAEVLKQRLAEWDVRSIRHSLWDLGRDATNVIITWASEQFGTETLVNAGETGIFSPPPWLAALHADDSDELCAAEADKPPQYSRRAA